MAIIATMQAVNLYQRVVSRVRTRLTLSDIIPPGQDKLKVSATCIDSTDGSTGCGIPMPDTSVYPVWLAISSSDGRNEQY